MSATICLFPGSFDPVTNGHMDIIRRAAGMFDTLIVGVFHNPEKRGCFPVEQRVDMLKRACEGLPNVEIVSDTGLVADFARKRGVTVLARGVRGMADLESETAMARVNHQLNPALETVFLPASPQAEQISASMVRQLASFGVDVSPYVPSPVLPDLLAAFPYHSPTI